MAQEQMFLIGARVRSSAHFDVKSEERQSDDGVKEYTCNGRNRHRLNGENKSYHAVLKFFEASCHFLGYVGHSWS